MPHGTKFADPKGNDVKPTQLEARDDPKTNTNYLSSGACQPCDLARASSSLSASELPLCLNGQLAFVVAKIASYICSIRTYSNVASPVLDAVPAGHRSATVTGPVQA